MRVGQTILYTLGVDIMSQKVLVAYASRSGSTTEVAEFIGQVFHEAGFEPEVTHVGQVNSIGPYELVILGSAARVGKLLPEMLKFVKRNAAELVHKKTAYFSVSMTMCEDTPENRDTVAVYLEPLLKVKEPVCTGLFAGKYDSSSVNFLLRQILKKMKVPEGDFRDWEEIRRWSQELAHQISE